MTEHALGLDLRGSPGTLKFIDTLGPSVHLSPQPNLLTVALARRQVKFGTHVEGLSSPTERFLRAEPSTSVSPCAPTFPAQERLDRAEGLELRFGSIGEALHN